MVEQSLIIKNYILSGSALGLLAILWWGFKLIGVRIIENLDALNKHKDKSEVQIAGLEGGGKKSSQDISELFKRQYEHLEKISAISYNLEKQKLITDNYNAKVLELELDIKERTENQLRNIKELSDKYTTLKSEHDKCKHCNQ